MMLIPVVKSMSKAYDRMYLEWVKMNDKCKKMHAQMSKLFCKKLRFKSVAINLQTTILKKEEKLKPVSVELESTQISLRIMNSGTEQSFIRFWLRENLVQIIMILDIRMELFQVQILNQWPNYHYYGKVS